MKAQFTIFLLLIFTIPSFGQNTVKNTSLEIKQLPNTKIKPITSDSESDTDEKRRGTCRPYYVIEGQLRIVGECEEFGYCRGTQLIFSGTEASKYSGATNYCSVIIDNSNQIKKHYTALKERYSNRYPNSNNQKTPELQSTLQEIRF